MPRSKTLAPCICSYEADDEEELAKHAWDHKCKIYKCNHCKYITYGRHLLVFHKDTDRYQCEICCDSFDTLNDFLSHEIIAHQGGVEDPRGSQRFNEANMITPSSKNDSFRCKSCSYTSKAQGTMAIHILNNHTSQHVCNKCSFSSINRNKFIQHHIKVHTSDGLVECPDCFAVLNGSSAFKDHVKKHVNLAKQIPLDDKCPAQDCTFIAQTKSDLEAHVLECSMYIQECQDNEDDQPIIPEVVMQEQSSEIKQQAP